NNEVLTDILPQPDLLLLHTLYHHWNPGLKYFLTYLIDHLISHNAMKITGRFMMIVLLCQRLVLSAVYCLHMDRLFLCLPLHQLILQLSYNQYGIAAATWIRSHFASL